MKTESFSKLELRVAALAGQVLPLVQAHPETAYPKALSELIAVPPERTSWTHENEVGAALRYLEQNGILTSEKVPHPKGHVGSKVKLYRPTPKGAFVISLAAQKKAA